MCQQCIKHTHWEPQSRVFHIIVELVSSNTCLHCDIKIFWIKLKYLIHLCHIYTDATLENKLKIEQTKPLQCNIFTNKITK